MVTRAAILMVNTRFKISTRNLGTYALEKHLPNLSRIIARMLFRKINICDICFLQIPVILLFQNLGYNLTQSLTASLIQTRSTL